ncbi:hypothetical protein HD554DRAFT_2085651 [Boletus coccyginus]|nr:hypothetical protein HD554DRAFT_2085651 [Boletus coccyginus]
MLATIALLCLLSAILALLLLRPLPALPALPPPPTPHPPPPLPLTPPLPIRHVSFSDTSYSPPAQPRWSFPFRKRKSAPDSQPSSPPPVDQFGRILPSSPKSARRLSTPIRLSSKRRSSTASCTSTLIHLDQVDTRAPSPPSSTPATLSFTPPPRSRFVNPFSKHSRSRTLSPPSNNLIVCPSLSFNSCTGTSMSLDSSSLNPSRMSSPSSPPARHRTIVNKLKSIFKSTPPVPPPIIQPKPILTTISTRLRRKPVARTEPYGPPWNAPMPVPDLTLSQQSWRKTDQTMSSFPQPSRKRSVHEHSCPEKTLMSPGQLSPRTFINELDEKLSLLQQQAIRDSISSPHG